MYRNSRLTRAWAMPRWVHYGTAVLSCLAVAFLKIALTPVTQDRMQFLFFTFAVCLSAFIGGLGPGLLAAAISIVLGIEIMPHFNARLGNADPLVITAFMLLWAFISFVCDILRKSASGFHSTVIQRDEKEQVLNAILQQATDGLLTIDKNSTINLANESFGAMFSVKQSDLIGTSINYIGKYLTESPDWNALCAIAHRDGRATVDLETTSGRWLNFRLFPGRNDACSIFVQDVTIQKHLELNQLQMLAAERNARSKAEESNRIKDGFLAMLSHELRTPLTSILGWTELLAPQAPPGTMMAEGLAAILKSTQTQKSLIDQLLDMSRITTGKMMINRHLLDIGDVVGEAVNALRPTANARNIDLHFVGLEEPCLLLGDESRLIQILNNLITNAIKFSPENSRVDIELSYVDGDSIKISIQDFGEGIDADLLPVIFDPFQQADSSITRQHGGMGLGLALAKQLALQHDGKIVAKSMGRGQGSTFELILPVRNNMRVREPNVPEPIEPDALAGTAILVVEDDQSTREVLGVILQNAGAEVSLAESGAQALQVLEDQEIDILVSDLGMPMMDGYELIRRIRQHGKEGVAHILAVSLSAFAFKEDIDAALEAGFNACLTKPVTASALVRQLVQEKRKGAAH